MLSHNARNERIKREYFVFLQEAAGRSEATIDQIAAALARFEVSTKWRDFARFHREQAIAFKRYLAEQRTPSGAPLSKATISSIVLQVRKFFEWLATQPGYKATVKYSDAEFFRLSLKDDRIAGARRERPVPSVDHIKRIVLGMPMSSDVERRNRALIAFTLLTGARDSAIASLQVQHVDLANQCIYQDARAVKTKFGKSFRTDFFPVGDEIKAIVIEWVQYLRDSGCGEKDPLFPATRTRLSGHQFAAAGLSRTAWKNAGPIRRIFKDACKAIGLPYYNPHSFRNTLVGLAKTQCRTVEDFKAWSQNLGHESPLTTLHSYGAVAPARQADIMRELASPIDRKEALAQKVAALINQELVVR